MSAGESQFANLPPPLRRKLEDIQASLTKEVNKVQELQKKRVVMTEQRARLSNQLTENEFVQEEFAKMESGDCIYKLLGPVLVAQEADEAKETVQKRLDYIKAEIKRLDDGCADYASRIKDCQQQCNEYQRAAQHEVTSFQEKLQKMASR